MARRTTSAVIGCPSPTAADTPGGVILLTVTQKSGQLGGVTLTHPRSGRGAYAGTVGKPLALDNAVGLCPGDHASWAYEDLPGLRAACTTYLGDGLLRGERLVYVGDRQHGHLVDDLAGLANRDAMLDSGQLEVHTVDELYRGDGQFRAHVQVEAFRRRAEQAVDDGYTGLRILGDITELIVDESLTQQLIEYEVAVDAMFASRPALALCAFDRE